MFSICCNVCLLLFIACVSKLDLYIMGFMNSLRCLSILFNCFFFCLAYVTFVWSIRCQTKYGTPEPDRLHPGPKDVAVVHTESIGKPKQTAQGIFVIKLKSGKNAKSQRLINIADKNRFQRKLENTPTFGENEKLDEMQKSQIPFSRAEQVR